MGAVVGSTIWFWTAPILTRRLGLVCSSLASIPYPCKSKFSDSLNSNASLANSSDLLFYFLMKCFYYAELCAGMTFDQPYTCTDCRRAIDSPLCTLLWANVGPKFFANPLFQMLTFSIIIIFFYQSISNFSNEIRKVKKLGCVC